MNLESDWLARRARLCLKAGVTNLNAGSCSPTCRVALDAQLAFLRSQAEDPVEAIFRYAPAAANASRAAIAGVLGCPPQDVLLFNNTTYGVNTVARGLALEPGDEVVMSDQEYVHYVTMWQRLVAETGARLVTVALPAAATDLGVTSAALAERFAAALTVRTRVLFFSHVTSATGLVLPAAALCRLARQHGAVSIVDGAHAIGLVPVSVPAIQPDYYAATAHKWLMGPVGTGLLYVAPHRQALTPPLITTDSFRYDRAAAGESIGYGGPSRWAYSHEYQGTRDHAPILAAEAAVRFHAEVPLAEVAGRWGMLAGYCRTRLGRLGLAPASHAAPELATCLVAFVAPLPGGRRLDPAKAGRYLRERHGIEVAFPTLADGQQLLRVATAWFNTKDEIDALALVLSRLAWEALV